MGTQEGGHKTAKKNRKKDPQFYSVIGQMGGNTITDRTKFRGFGSNRAKASAAGKVGGAISRRPAMAH